MAISVERYYGRWVSHFCAMFFHVIPVLSCYFVILILYYGVLCHINVCILIPVILFPDMLLGECSISILHSMSLMLTLYFFFALVWLPMYVSILSHSFQAISIYLVSILYFSLFLCHICPWLFFSSLILLTTICRIMSITFRGLIYSYYSHLYWLGEYSYLFFPFYINLKIQLDLSFSSIWIYICELSILSISFF